MSCHSPFRRKFFKLSATTVLSIIMGCFEKGGLKSISNQQLSTGKSTPSPQHGSTPPNRTSAKRCRTTSRDITGPYWRDGVPIRNQFDLYGHPGQKLSLSGFVRDAHCRPIPEAVIEMWHAYPTTMKPGALEPKHSVDYDLKSPAFKYYGQFATNQLGHYSMTTKKPGWYLNGDSFRPSHIHVKIYINGVERLTTQLYFKGDPFLAADPWASAAHERIIELTPTESGQLAADFDFSLPDSA